MNAPLAMPTPEKRITRCQVDIAAIRRAMEGMRYDLEWLSGAAQTPAVFELGMVILANEMQALADHAREITDTLKRRREDGAEADQRIDQLIAGTVQ